MTESEKTSHAYNDYIEALFAPEDDVLKTTRDEMLSEHLPSINVSASEGQLLHTLVLLSGAKRILEIGTLGGYSAIWMARALPVDGKLISLEIDSHHADVARRNIERADLTAKVDVRVGPALGSIAQLVAESVEPFDLIFIDADKDGYVDYLNKTFPLLRTGGTLLGDNTLPDAVLDPNGDSGTKRFNAAVAAHPGLVATIVPVLRGRGIDGLLIAIKK